ncbi:hypothetical protein [Nitrospira sp. BLG_2]|uniref:hypothetical protein n=1 Tax=Nitrospira sp. BLG_2 TaxID=3397507 RepID=UPI003B9A5221
MSNIFIINMAIIAEKAALIEQYVNRVTKSFFNVHLNESTLVKFCRTPKELSETVIMFEIDIAENWRRNYADAIEVDLAAFQECRNKHEKRLLGMVELGGLSDEATAAVENAINKIACMSVYEEYKKTNQLLGVS